MAASSCIVAHIRLESISQCCVLCAVWWYVDSQSASSQCYYNHYYSTGSEQRLTALGINSTTVRTCDKLVSCVHVMYAGAG